MFEWDDKPELNITPLVDIMLVLIAVLMLTTPVILYEESVSLPKGSKEKAIIEKDFIEVTVNKNREILVDKNKFTILEFPDSFMVLSAKFDKEQKIVIKADGDLKYDDVVFVLKSIKAAKFSKISLVTDG